MAVHVLDEAQRCLQGKNPQCRKGCPIGTNIPEMIRLLKEKEILEAAYMLFANNPLSMSRHRCEREWQRPHHR